MKTSKTIQTRWQERGGPFWSFYCPLCSVPRRLLGSVRPTVLHVVQIGLTSVIFMLLTWNYFGWKGLVSFVPFWGMFELVFRVRVRIQAHCPNCGFDPYLFVVDEKQAKDEVENHWRKLFAEKGKPFPEKSATGRSRPSRRLHESN